MLFQPSSTFGVDLGGTKIDIGLVRGDGALIAREIIRTRVEDGPDAIVGDIAGVIERLKKQAPSVLASGIGVGVAGQIDKASGAVFFAPNLRWENFPLQEKLSKASGLPVYVTNDVRAATWGEWLFGAGKEINDLLCLFVGTGIGGGVVSGGNVLVGDTNAAAEVGHITLDLNGPPCTCGNRGCFEALAGGWAIGRRTREAIAQHPHEGKAILDLAGGDIEKVHSGHLFEAYNKNDPLAIKIVEEVKEALIAGVAGLINTFNPKRLILGGGVIMKNPELIEAIRAGVPKRALKISTRGLEIAQAQLGNDAGVCGSAAFAAHQSRGDHV